MSSYSVPFQMLKNHIFIQFYHNAKKLSIVYKEKTTKGTQKIFLFFFVIKKLHLFFTL